MIKKYLPMAVVAILLAIAIFTLDLAALVGHMGSINVWVWTLLVAMQVTTQLLINWQWHVIAKAIEKPVPYQNMIYINSQGAVVDAITPGVKIGGEITRGVMLTKVGGYTPTQAGALVAIQKLFSIGALGVVLLLVANHMATWVALLVFAPVVLAPGNVKGYLLKKKAPSHRLLHKVWAGSVTLLGYLQLIKANKKAFALLCGLSLLIWALYPVKAYILVWQFYTGIHFTYVAGITFGAYMVAMLPIFPGGAGGYEGTMTALLVATGLDINYALAIAMLFRFITFWLVMLMGAVYVWVYKLKKGSG